MTIEPSSSSTSAPPAKRIKLGVPNSQSGRRIIKNDNAPIVEIPPHPLGIRPSGNVFAAPYNLRDTSSSGLFGCLPDELILEILGFFDVKSLVAIGVTSKCLYAFSRAEELWKALYIELSNSPTPPPTTWLGTWRTTTLSLPASRSTTLQVPHLYSDALYRPFFCAHYPYTPFTSAIPKHNLVPRYSNLSPEEFPSHFTRPFILTDPVRSWPALQKWTPQHLLDKYASTPFVAEALTWPFSTYNDYITNCAQDESPLYLFDKTFTTKTTMGEDYTVPELFQEDYFTVLGEERPDFRWLVLGPPRSGSTFHKDPNATSAWNAVVRGEKYWIMFPPSTPPPGVFVSEDKSEVTSPLSLMEWFLNFHAEARATAGCLEGICKAGEVLYVPSGWWHAVVNVGEEIGIAVTQNFVTRGGVAETLRFLSEEAQSVSGFNCEKVKDPYGLFRERLGERYPEILKEAEETLEKRGGKWEKLMKEKEQIKTGGGLFGFSNFDDESSDEESEKEE